MKKLSIAVMALLFSIFLFSCTEDSISETDTLYDMQSTEGDDSDVNDPPTGGS